MSLGLAEELEVEMLVTECIGPGYGKLGADCEPTVLLAVLQMTE